MSALLLLAIGLVITLMVIGVYGLCFAIGMKRADRRGYTEEKQRLAEIAELDPPTGQWLADISAPVPGERVRGRLYMRKAGLLPRPRPRRRLP